MDTLFATDASSCDEISSSWKKQQDYYPEREYEDLVRLPEIRVAHFSPLLVLEPNSISHSCGGPCAKLYPARV